MSFLIGIIIFDKAKYRKKKVLKKEGFKLSYLDFGILIDCENTYGSSVIRLLIFTQ